jgi:PAS domain-containing protein
LDLTTDPDFFALLAGSHLRLVGGPLAGKGATAAWVYEEAPFGLLAHDTAEDPRFVYANRTAQSCFEYDWAEFVGLPSRLSAEPGDREQRQRFVRSVERDGFATGYRGRRIARSGRRFWVEDLTMWNLVDESGSYHGQAAVFHKWSDG